LLLFLLIWSAKYCTICYCEHWKSVSSFLQDKQQSPPFYSTHLRPSLTQQPSMLFSPESCSAHDMPTWRRDGFPRDGCRLLKCSVGNSKSSFPLTPLLYTEKSMQMIHDEKDNWNKLYKIRRTLWFVTHLIKFHEQMFTSKWHLTYCKNGNLKE
jgi:hypothetical protein